MRDDDALWNPAAEGGAELRRLRALLAPYAVAGRGIGEWPPKRIAPPRRRRGFAAVLAAALAASLLLYAGYAYRFGWSEGQPWQVDLAGAARHPLAPGGVLETGARESLNVAVARIGRIELSPRSRLRLLETRSGRHRVSLDDGHLRARIWAPPGYFGVDEGAAEVVDLGCDFEVWKNADGRGRVYVRSGWVAYRLGAEEILLPSGFAIDFAGGRATTPLRPEATAAFAQAVHEFEQALDAGDESAAGVAVLSERVAATADDADAFTLLSLLTRHPALARSALYPRLATALGLSAADSAHRDAWIAGDQAAIDAWWRRIPHQPKHWWWNWSDALP